MHKFSAIRQKGHVCLEFLISLLTLLALNSFMALPALKVINDIIHSR